SEEDLDFSGTPITMEGLHAAAPAKPDESIPPAIRRMMELKPLFSKADIQAEPSDGGLEPFVENGAALSGLEAVPEPLATEPVIEEGEALDLGEEELDEAGIMAAVAHEEAVAQEALDESDPDLLELRSSDELELTEVESLQGWNEGQPLSQGPEELTLESDENELVLTSLDTEEPAEAEPLEGGTDSGGSTQLELTSLEQQAMQAVLDASLEEPEGPPPPMPGTEEGADLLGGELNPPPLEPLAAEPAGAELAAVESPPAAEALGAESAMEEELPEELPGELDFAEAGLPPLEESQADLWSPPEPEPPAPEAPVAAAPAPTPPAAPAAAPTPGPMEAAVQEEPGYDLDTLSGDMTEFEAAFAELREEIAANPEGEHLDDLLRVERIKELIAGVEFTIPQHESSFARGMALYALPQGLRMDEAPRRPTREAAPAPVPSAEPLPEAPPVAEGPPEPAPVRVQIPVQAAPDTEPGAAPLEWEPGASLLDESAKARLSDVLDEIISLSVRQAVREEMPKVMERLVKEPS
ncbi:MAG TPA: hypothetical protein VL359_14340, partial [bacterium]|nr:hypothetical protein [bacterium]